MALKTQSMKLSPMVDFVINEYDNMMWDSFNKINRYAEFLKQPLTLSMFVPCDEHGNVLEQPTAENSLNTIDHDSKLIDYNDAKLKVLFKNFTFSRKTKNAFFLLEFGVYTHVIDRKIPKTVESIISNDDLELTDTAIKMILG